MKTALIVFLGGGIGSVIRYLMSLLVLSFSNKSWIGTLIVNILGSMLFIFSHRLSFDLSSEQHHLFRVGLLGGLTTFSSLSIQTLDLLKSGYIIEGIGSLLLNIFFGIVVGLWIIR